MTSSLVSEIRVVGWDAQGTKHVLMAWAPDTSITRDRMCAIASMYGGVCVEIRWVDTDEHADA